MPAASIAVRIEPNCAAATLALGHRAGSERYRADPLWPAGACAGDQAARRGGAPVSSAQSLIASSTRRSVQTRRFSPAQPRHRNGGRLRPPLPLVGRPQPRHSPV